MIKLYAIIASTGNNKLPDYIVYDQNSNGLAVTTSKKQANIFLKRHASSCSPALTLRISKLTEEK